MNIQKMMQQAQQMQEKMQRQMTEMRVEGNAGGGMVVAGALGRASATTRKTHVGCTITAEKTDAGILSGARTSW